MEGKICRVDFKTLENFMRDALIGAGVPAVRTEMRQWGQRLRRVRTVLSSSPPARGAEASRSSEEGASERRNGSKRDIGIGTGSLKAGRDAPRARAASEGRGFLQKPASASRKMPEPGNRDAGKDPSG